MRKGITRILSLILSVCLCVTPMMVQAETTNQNTQPINAQGIWQSYPSGWWYQNPDGTYPANSWQRIDGQWYLFDASGYMLTGWQLVGNKWYFLHSNGAMAAASWLQYGDTWYYLYGDGSMAIGWNQLGGLWYFFDENGAMLTDWHKIGNNWYFLHSNGAMAAASWLQYGNTWYYLYGDGSMATGWFQQGDAWYYFRENGAMAVGWVGNYFCGQNGAWIPGYVGDGSSGTWQLNSNGWWYSYHTGGYPVEQWESIGGNWYYFNGAGYMVSGWQYIGGYKYYFNGNGALVQNLDGVIGRQGSYQIKVNKQANCITAYASDGANGYIIPVKSFICSTGVDTPLGTYGTKGKYRWQTLQGPTYGQFCTRIVGGILFHSVPCSRPNNRALITKYYNQLGKTASAGCVRMTVADAKWIYDNCSVGTQVTIYNSAKPGPYDKPTAAKLPAGQTWDPTDPTL